MREGEPINARCLKEFPDKICAVRAGLAEFLLDECSHYRQSPPLQNWLIFLGLALASTRVRDRIPSLDKYWSRVWAVELFAHREGL